MTARIIDGQVFDAEEEARRIRETAAAELAAVRAEVARAQADAAKARAQADAARADAARIRRDAGLPPGDGAVTAVIGLQCRARVADVSIGDIVRIARSRAAADVDVSAGDMLDAEVVGFRDDEVILLPLGDLHGVAPGAPVTATAASLAFPCGPALLGRVLDGVGRPADGGPAVDAPPWSVERAAPAAASRPPVARPLVTGVRAIDGLLTLGEGQRIGVFAAAGVGKSTLLTQLARTADADVIVLGLVGERGRELGDYLAALGPARARTVVVCATSDAPSLVRVRAASTATAVAEHFRDAGRRVLLVVDSLTRVARAQREVGLSAGEPPARHGYPPSVFALLPRLVERAGTTSAGPGSITAVYAVLVAGDDLDEPIADEVRGIVDGHIVLDRRLAGRGHFPPIDVVASLSRLFERLAPPAQREAAARLRACIARYEDRRDLIAVGAYKAGTDRALDDAIARLPAIERFLRQPADEVSPAADTLAALRSL
jgi:ATP synthase in type III secretion protein N